MPSGPRKLDQVVEAAVAEFQEVGFTAAHMDRIAGRARVSKRTLYNYFESKEALFFEIIQRANTMLQPAADTQFDPSSDLAEQVYTMALRQMTPYGDAQNIKLIRLVIGEWLRNPNLVAGLVAQIERTTEAKRFFHQMAQAGLVDPAKADELARDVTAFIKGRCLWTAMLTGNPPSQNELRQSAQTIKKLFLPYLR